MKSVVNKRDQNKQKQIDSLQIKWGKKIKFPHLTDYEHKGRTHARSLVCFIGIFFCDVEMVVIRVRACTWQVVVYTRQERTALLVRTFCATTHTATVRSQCFFLLVSFSKFTVETKRTDYAIAVANKEELLIRI